MVKFKTGHKRLGIWLSMLQIDGVCLDGYSAEDMMLLPIIRTANAPVTEVRGLRYFPHIHNDGH